MSDTCHRTQNQISSSVQRLQPKEVHQKHFLVFHLNDCFILIVETKLTRLPRSDDSVVSSTDQHQLLNAQEVLFPSSRVGIRSLVVQQGQIVAAVDVHVSVMRVVPVVTDRYFLSHCSIAHMIQVGFDKLREEVLQIVCVSILPRLRRGQRYERVHVMVWKSGQDSSTHQATLRVADEVDAIGCVLHDGIYGFCKALHLLPERLQAGAAVKQVQDSHVSARVRQVDESVQVDEVRRTVEEPVNDDHRFIRDTHTQHTHGGQRPHTRTLHHNNNNNTTP